MCTKTIQNETKKRRDIQDALRPLAAAHFAHSLQPGEQQVAGVLHEVDALIKSLGIRECCLTFPGEPHGSQGHGCFLR